MTKEWILKTNASVPKPQIPGVLEAMQEYADQESKDRDNRIKELEKENKKLLQYWIIHNPEMPTGFGHPEIDD